MESENAQLMIGLASEEEEARISACLALYEGFSLGFGTERIQSAEFLDLLEELRDGIAGEFTFPVGETLRMLILYALNSFGSDLEGAENARDRIMSVLASPFLTQGFGTPRLDLLKADVSAQMRRVSRRCKKGQWSR